MSAIRAVESDKIKTGLNLSSLNNGVSSTKAITVNKDFLRNTIQFTDSHNKREEIAECWREHEMLQKSSSIPRKLKQGTLQSQERISGQSNDTEQELNRIYWAERKLSNASECGQKRTLSGESDGDALAATEDSDSTDSAKEKKKKKHKKSKKHKKNKKLKK